MALAIGYIVIMPLDEIIAILLESYLAVLPIAFGLWLIRILYLLIRKKLSLLSAILVFFLDFLAANLINTFLDLSSFDYVDPTNLVIWASIIVLYFSSLLVSSKALEKIGFISLIWRICITLFFIKLNSLILYDSESGYYYINETGRYNRISFFWTSTSIIFSFASLAICFIELKKNKNKDANKSTRSIFSFQNCAICVFIGLTIYSAIIEPILVICIIVSAFVFLVLERALKLSVSKKKLIVCLTAFSALGLIIFILGLVLDKAVLICISSIFFCLIYFTAISLLYIKNNIDQAGEQKEQQKYTETHLGIFEKKHKKSEKEKRKEVLINNQIKYFISKY